MMWTIGNRRILIIHKKIGCVPSTPQRQIGQTAPSSRIAIAQTAQKQAWKQGVRAIWTSRSMQTEQGGLQSMMSSGSSRAAAATSGSIYQPRRQAPRSWLPESQRPCGTLPTSPSRCGLSAARTAAPLTSSSTCAAAAGAQPSTQLTPS